MPAFESSDLADGKRVIWENSVKNLSHSHINIYGDYWERFNTMRVPILGEDRFLEIALELERVAKDQEDLEKLLAERQEEWEREAKQWLGGIARKSWRGGESFQCKDASDSAYRASVTGSLQHFLELLNGVVHGWEPDEVQDETPNDTDMINPKSNHQNPAVETDDELEETQFNKLGYEYYMRRKLVSKNPVYEPTYDGNVHKAPFFKSDQALLIRQRFGKLKGKRSHDEDEEAQPSEPSGAANSSNLNNASRPKKRPRFDDEPSVTVTEGLSQNGSGRAIDRTDKISARKRHRPDDDDDAINGGERKRQKRASSSEHPAAIPQGDGESNAKKAPQRNSTKSKRQKRPIIQTSTSPEPSKSFSAVTDVVLNPPEIFTAPTSRTNPSTPKKVTKQAQSVTKKESASIKKTNRVQKHTKRSSTSHNLNSSSLSSSSRGTRASSRRKNSSSLWELDSSGKPSQQ